MSSNFTSLKLQIVYLPTRHGTILKRTTNHPPYLRKKSYSHFHEEGMKQEKETRTKPNHIEREIVVIDKPPNQIPVPWIISQQSIEDANWIMEKKKERTKKKNKNRAIFNVKTTEKSEFSSAKTEKKRQVNGCILKTGERKKKKSCTKRRKCESWKIERNKKTVNFTFK